MEIKTGITSIGPHRDDFDFMIGNNNLKTMDPKVSKEVLFYL